MTPPPCPITGAPATERLQTVPAKLLHDIWRFGIGVDPAPLRRDHGTIGLWRSPCGLAFFHPAIAGAPDFYRGLFRRVGADAHLARHAATRGDFLAGAAVVRPGDTVLDVGCGAGDFAAHVSTARYVGIDTAAPAQRDPRVRVEPLHAHAGRYDVVCGFQVLEHVADPLGFARAMLDRVKPGGALVLALPLWPSPATALPNNPVMLPPHHLTWWTAAACAALCTALDLTPERIAPVPAYPAQAPLHWAARFCPVRTAPGAWVRPRWRWHAALAAAALAGRAAGRLFGLPAGAEPIDILLIARKKAR